MENKIETIEDLWNKPDDWKNCWLEGELVGLRVSVNRWKDELLTGILVERSRKWWAEVLFFPEVYRQFREMITVGASLRLRGRFNAEFGHAILSVSEVEAVG